MNPRAVTDVTPISHPRPRSHVVILSIPDDQAEEVDHILERLWHDRGWRSRSLGLSSPESAQLAAESCDQSLRRFDSSVPGPSFIPRRLYPSFERNLSLQVPDRQDVPLFPIASPSFPASPNLPVHSGGAVAPMDAPGHHAAGATVRLPLRERLRQLREQRDSR